MNVETFVNAASVEEAVAAMAAGARAVAGGTDLVVGARQGKAPLPESLVAIHRIEELRSVAATGDGGLRIGALVTHESLAGHAVVRERFTALADAAAIVGSHATRAQGTIGGNLMNASPAMETGGPLVCFGATAELHSARDSRGVAVAELFAGPGRTTADADELLTSVGLPAPADGTGSCYLRLEYRRQMEIAVVGATAVVTLNADRVADARIAITALAPTIHRVAEAEAALVATDGGRDAARPPPPRRRRCGTDLRRPCLGRLPPRHGRRHRAPGDRSGARPRTRRDHPCARQLGTARGCVLKVATMLVVNGISYPVEIAPGASLLDAVRNTVGLTGSKEGCDDSECGACMMLLDGKPVNSCSYLALQAEGREITTVEGLSSGEDLHPLQAAFLEQGGVQCGFCTPGMLISAVALLRTTPHPTEEEVRIALSGNLCRCTGYDGIVKAMLQVADSPRA